MAVLPALVKRCKNHFHTLPCGVGVVIGLRRARIVRRDGGEGNNGYIWIGGPIGREQPEHVEDQADDAEPVALSLDVRAARGDAAIIRADGRQLTAGAHLARPELHSGPGARASAHLRHQARPPPTPQPRDLTVRSIIYAFEDSEPYASKELLQADLCAEITQRAKALKLDH